MPTDDKEEGEDHLHGYGGYREESFTNLFAKMDEQSREKFKNYSCSGVN